MRLRWRGLSRGGARFSRSLDPPSPKFSVKPCQAAKLPQLSENIREKIFLKFADYFAQIASLEDEGDCSWSPRFFRSLWPSDRQDMSGFIARINEESMTGMAANKQATRDPANARFALSARSVRPKPPCSRREITRKTIGKLGQRRGGVIFIPPGGIFCNLTTL